MKFEKIENQKSIFNCATMHDEKIEEQDVIYVPKNIVVVSSTKIVIDGGIL